MYSALKISGYIKSLDESKYMLFWIKVNTYKKYIIKSSNSIKKRFGCKPMFDEKYLKSKIKSYKNKINKNFHDNEMPEEGSLCKFLSAILIFSVIKIGKIYYKQELLKECKYIVSKKR